MYLIANAALLQTEAAGSRQPYNFNRNQFRFYTALQFLGHYVRGVVAQWLCSMPSVRKVADLNPTLAVM